MPILRGVQILLRHRRRAILLLLTVWFGPAASPLLADEAPVVREGSEPAGYVIDTLKGKHRSDYSPQPTNEFATPGITTLRQTQRTEYEFRDGRWRPCPPAGVSAGAASAGAATGSSDARPTEGAGTLSPAAFPPPRPFSHEADELPRPAATTSEKQPEAAENRAVAPASLTLAPAREARAERNAAPQAQRELVQEGFLVSIALANFISNLAALVVGVALFYAVFRLLLSRYGGVAGLQMDLVGRRLAEERVQRLDPIPDLETVLRHAPRASLDFGSSYADELQRQQAQEGEQEAAMLQHIFEQNVHLREQIGALEGAAA